VSKIFAHYNTLPEIYHDEIVGWEMRPELREKFFALFITDKSEPDINKKRTELLKGIFIEKDIDFEEIAIEGSNDVVKGFKGIFLADWISLYLAILNRVDPNAITLVDVIKKRLEQIDKS
jgi:glucose/mannose-6-phosphate isomerase